MSGGKDPSLDITPVGGASATEAVDPAGAVGSAQPAGAAQGPGLVADVTRALAAGEIDAAEAQRRIIEAVVAEQLPADATPELEAAIRNDVASMLEGDPTLAALLQT